MINASMARMIIKYDMILKVTYENSSVNFVNNDVY